jgi:hypothetical protein
MVSSSDFARAERGLVLDRWFLHRSGHPPLPRAVAAHA